ncbi:hypothetical protein CHS0354_010918 [Potamilus streckersoni]|uniref:Uncharacterized protein n=1 Tax=Potamilus streckersoni TaxID=2493646 RepID=A0AAE0W0U9_9BIVA|nr:hypothetical protein CHS0354_010918 [Potamilus streckersoni]
MASSDVYLLVSNTGRLPRRNERYETAGKKMEAEERMNELAKQLDREINGIRKESGRKPKIEGKIGNHRGGGKNKAIRS